MLRRAVSSIVSTELDQYTVGHTNLSIANVVARRGYIPDARPESGTFGTCDPAVVLRARYEDETYVSFPFIGFVLMPFNQNYVMLSI